MAEERLISLTQRRPPVCPTSGAVGRLVGAQTLDALLLDPATVSRDTRYFFCADQDCPTVYYSEDQRQVFGEVDLRATVFQKHRADDDTLVCYCLGYTVGAIRAERCDDAEGDILQTIIRTTRAGACACETRNPQGSCCLGNVQSLIRDRRTAGENHPVKGA